MGTSFSINKNSDSRYKIIKLLGEGGFGKVYLVEKNSKYYALKKISLKELSEEDRELCKKEIDILSSFNNKYIVKFYEAYLEDDCLNIIMEYAGDSNLKTFIDKYKIKSQLIDEKSIKYIILQICLGLKEIHKANIIHRDLTPDNIFINENNLRIKIGDFGISKVLETKNYAKSKIGKYKYFAPEIELGQKYNNKVDIYSLGCIIYELFTLNEYYIDKKVCNGDGKINLDLYDKKWQDLIDLTLKYNYEERPTIEKIYRDAFSIVKNEIIITVDISRKNINQKIYFLDNTNKHDNLKEMNKNNTELYINNVKYEYQKYFIPKKEGIYHIKIKFNFLVNNCSYMFHYCKNIINIDLSSFVTKNVYNMRNMLSDCFILKNINLSNIDTRNVTNMEYMFSCCSFLKHVDLSFFNTQKVTDMRYIFSCCENLEYLNLSSFNTKNVKNMKYMFSNCLYLKGLDLSSFDTKNVISMDYMFSNCMNLNCLDLSSFDTKNVISMEGMFYLCYDLEYLNLSSFNIENAINLKKIFKFSKPRCSCKISRFRDKKIELKINRNSYMKITNFFYFYNSFFDLNKTITVE